MGEEADALSDQYDDSPSRGEVVYNWSKQYNKNKSAKVGQMITCPVCRVSFKKKTHSQVFCGIKHKHESSCKDKFWNYADDERYQKTKEVNGIEDDDDDDYFTSDDL